MGDWGWGRAYKSTDNETQRSGDRHLRGLCFKALQEAAESG